LKPTPTIAQNYSLTAGTLRMIFKSKNFNFVLLTTLKEINNETIEMILTLDLHQLKSQATTASATLEKLFLVDQSKLPTV